MQCSYETSTHWKTVGSSKAIRFQVNGLPFIQTFRIIANAVLEASVAPMCGSKAEAEATGLFQWRLLIFGHFHVSSQSLSF